MAKSDIKYLTTQRVEVRQKKYCRFKKMGIKYIDYKDGEFLKKFINDQGKLLPRRLTGNSLKFQRKVATAVKKCRQMAILPYVTDLLK
ncbi:MAG TPA: 30S ribosomal protein S18 [Chitinophagaceae bacterium]|jgi:small subunit ribosomal protein S18|nr:30S ribosomal protein S18 [Chitinophagaceae bacterium]